MNNRELINSFKKILGNKYVTTDEKSMERFCKGFRSGAGKALAVLHPGTLLEQWQVVKACVESDKIIIMQAANTGLTEGSTPNGVYDREVVIISTNRMDQIQVLDKGKQILSFPGSTLFKLERILKPLNRQPHSVIGSSSIGASIIGGVCNNSGGSLIERGVAYTELSLFAQITDQGELQLVNHLGIELGDTPEEILTRLEKGDYTEEDVLQTNKNASDKEYIDRIRNIDAETPARYNADKSKLYEVSGCAGKLVVFSVRLDTFPKNTSEATFYIGTNTPEELTELRRTILKSFKNLPVSAEYVHSGIFDLAKKYGKDTLMMIKYLGTDYLPMFFALKGTVDAHLNKIKFLPKNLIDHFMQLVSGLWPEMLPKSILKWREDYEHHLILKMHGEGIEEGREFLKSFFNENTGNYFECTPKEAKLAALHRFAAAGAPVRYQAVHHKEVEDVIALDIALKRNDKNWLEVLPKEITDKLVHTFYYGHFMCHVFHHDYIVKKDEDPKEIKAKMLELLNEKGAEYPAEHNVGHIYKAKPDLANFYKSIDPTNSLNPGLGKMSKAKNYAETP